MVCHGRLLIGPPLLDDRRVVDDRTRHHAPRARMDGWWPCALGDFIQTYRARPTAVFWGIPGYAQPGVCRSWGKCAIAFPSPNSLGIEMPRTIDTRTVLMDESPHPPDPAATAGSSARAPWPS